MIDISSSGFEFIQIKHIQRLDRIFAHALDSVPGSFFLLLVVKLFLFETVIESHLFFLRFDFGLNQYGGRRRAAMVDVPGQNKGSVKSFAQIWFADLDMNEVSRQWGHPQGLPPGASYSCTFCFPTESRLHGAAGHKPA